MTTLSPTRRATRRARRASPQPSVRRVPGCSPAETRRLNARQQSDVAVDRKPLSTRARRIAAMTQHEQRGGAVGTVDSDDEERSETWAARYRIARKPAGPRKRRRAERS